LSKEKYTCKPHVPLHKTATIYQTANISYKLCTHVRLIFQLPYKQEKMDWSEPKENKTKKKS
jgi:hypothetical protein